MENTTNRPKLFRLPPTRAARLLDLVDGYPVMSLALIVAGIAGLVAALVLA